MRSHPQWHKLIELGKSWLLAWGMALLSAMVLAGLAWAKATDVDYRIQDDGRQHIFWMLRYVDPTLFPNDIIADYFQAQAPWLYRGIYATAWQFLGVEPQDLALVLPPVLGLVAVSYACLIGRHLSPVPLASGLAGLLCAQTLWMEDDLVSATPRAFATPLMLAFLFYVLRRNPWGCGLVIAMQGGTYPPAALISWGTLCCRLGDRRNWYLGLISTIALGLGLLPLVLQSDAFGAMIMPQAARSMLEFQLIDGEYGRAFFFHDNPVIFWGFGPRSGFFFWGLMAPLNLAALGWGWGQRQGQGTDALDHGRFKRSPLHPDSQLLGQFILSVIVFYGVAHLALFKLHFPARYTYHGFRTVLPIAAGIVLAEIIRWQVFKWQSTVRQAVSLEIISEKTVGKETVVRHRSREYTGLERKGYGNALSSWPHRGIILTLASVQGVLLLLPFVPDLNVGNQLYATGRVGPLYEFLHTTSKDTLVATIDKEGNNLPIFGRRSLLVGAEYALPYHPDYYEQLRQRAQDLLLAHAAPDPAPLDRLLQRYPITYLLVREDSFTPRYLRDREWLYPFQPEFDLALQQLEAQQDSGEKSVLQQLVPTCTALKVGRLSLVEAACLRDRLPRTPVSFVR